MCSTKHLPFYITADGQRTLHGSPEEVVDLLREGSFDPGEDRKGWMRNAAGRAREQNGSLIRWGSEEEFLTDLVHSGLLRKVVIN